MSYIGSTPQTQAFSPAVDIFSGNGSATVLSLSKPVLSAAQVQVVVNNVPQNPASAFTVGSQTITFTSAPSSGTNNIYVYYVSPITQAIAPSQGTVTTASLSPSLAVPVANVSGLAAVATSGSATDLSAGTLAKARLPTGSVLQVVTTVKNDTFSSTSSTNVDITGLSVTITPTSSSSNILVLVQSNGAFGAGSQILNFQLVRNSTNIANPSNTGLQYSSTASAYNSVIDTTTNYSITYIDSPATTSATTYKVQGRNAGSSTWYVNRRNTADMNTVSTITVMEIAA